MSTETVKYVTGLLEGYQKDTRRMEALRFELNYPRQVTPDEMIESMNFGHGDGSGISKGNISNKTLYIASNYMDRTIHLNTEATDEVFNLLCSMEEERNRLLYYISLLDARDSEVINATYIELKSREELGEMFGVSVKSVSNMRKQAVKNLCALYDFTSKGVPHNQGGRYQANG